MSEASAHIPLFPLALVLFPGSRIPLHIFEERYRTMATACIRNDTPFGVNLFENNFLHQIGCTAVIEGLTRQYADGSFDVVVRGVRRYKLREYAAREDALLTAEVEFIDDFAPTADAGLQHDAVELHNQLVGIAFPERSEFLIDPQQQDETGLSFRIAEKAGLALTDRQRLLEKLSERERLRLLISHMMRVLPKLKRQETVRRIIAGDGFLPRATTPQ